MIGPTKSGSEGFARRLNRNDWIEANIAPTTKSEAVDACFATVFCISLGSLMAVGAVEIFKQAANAISL